MQQLMGETVTTTDNAFLRELFLQCLPANVRMVLASTNTGRGLGELAQLADKIMEVPVATPPVASVTHTNSSEVTQLCSEIGELHRLVEQMLSTSQSSRRQSPSPACASTSLCWYHQRFGSDAQKCCPPCSQSAGNDLASH